MNLNCYQVEEVAYEIIRARQSPSNEALTTANIITNMCKKFDVQWDVTSNIGTTLLHTFAMYDHMDAINALVEMGANINTADNWGNTILHHAFNIEGALNGDTQFEVVNWALNNGFKINDVNKDGQTPLFMLTDLFKAYDVAEDEQEIVVQFVEMFEAWGGDIYHADHQGRTFLDVLPTDNDEWMILDPALDPWRIKMQRHKLNEEAQAVSHAAKTKGRKI